MPEAFRTGYKEIIQERKMTEASMISTRIDLLKEHKDLITRAIDFKIAILEMKLRDITGSEIVQKMQRQKPRATNFDYKNEVETGDIAPETV